MVTHFAVQIIRQNAYTDETITTTLCGRSSSKALDGFNSAENEKNVTCKFCLAIISDGPKNWRYRKYISPNTDFNMTKPTDSQV